MSHISKIEIEINDLLALKQACKVMGLEFAENLREYKWYNGFSACDHVIKVPGANYELGVFHKDGRYELHCDFWNSGGLVQRIGPNAELLKKHYSLERVRNEAKKLRYNIREQQITNGTRLVLTR